MAKLKIPSEIEIRKKYSVPLIALFIAVSAWTISGSETITLKTYYPSPYGSYKKFKVTDSIAAGTDTSPLRINGNVVQNGNFTLTPQNCSAITAPSEGQLCSDASDAKKLKIYRNGAWHEVGGGEGDLFLSAWAGQMNNTALSIPIPPGSSYAIVDTYGSVRFWTDNFGAGSSYGSCFVVELGTGKSTGGLAFTIGVGDQYDYAAYWNSGIAGGDAFLPGIHGLSIKTGAYPGVSVSGNNILFSFPITGGTPNGTVVAKFYKRIR
ncbi:MAG: hypothetical protein WCS77_11010 [Elusimicrobiaceae bacterium]